MPKGKRSDEKETCSDTQAEESTDSLTVRSIDKRETELEQPRRRQQRFKENSTGRPISHYTKSLPGH